MPWRGAQYSSGIDASVIAHSAACSGFELAHFGGPAFAILGAAIVLVEAAAVLVLRAHYTMDVFAGAVTALWVWCASSALAPGIDAWLARLR